MRRELFEVDIHDPSYIQAQFIDDDVSTVYRRSGWKQILAKDTFMQLGRKYYSRDGVTMYTNPDFREGSKVGVYYNYYQYLPLRTKSDVPASVLNQYIENKKGLSKPSAMLNSGEVFIKYGEQYGMNPLLVFAMGIHESGWGVSNFAINNNNLFGWDAVDSNPSNAKKYESLEVGIKEHMALQLRGYLDVNYPNYSAKDNITYRKDGRYNGGHLGNRGTGLNLKYASDPYWGIKIAQYAYLIDDLAGLVDYQKYNLAIVTDGDEFLAKRSNVSNTNEKYNFNKDDIFYNYKSLNGYMHNVTIAVEDFDTNNYKTQSFATIDQNLKVTNIYSSSKTPAYEYNWERSSGYFKKSKVDIIIESIQNKPDNIPEDKPEDKHEFEDVKIDHPFYKFVRYLSENNITTGYTEGDKKGTFGVNENLSRRHASMFLFRALGLEKNDIFEGIFNDVKENDSGAYEIEAIARSGIISGYDNVNGSRSFKPNNNLTRAQFAKMTAKAYGFEEVIGKTLNFSDVNKDFWAYDFIKVLVDNDIISGYPNGTYGSNNYMTRGHLSKFLYNSEIKKNN